MALLSGVALAQTPATRVFYASPSASGAANNCQTAQTACTPQRAIDIAAASRAAQPAGEIQILFAPGTYGLSAPLTIPISLSGASATERTILRPSGTVTVNPREGIVVFSGGVPRPAGTWTLDTSYTGTGRGVRYSLELGSNAFDDHRELYVNGARAIRARTPFRPDSVRFDNPTGNPEAENRFGFGYWVSGAVGAQLFTLPADVSGADSKEWQATGPNSKPQIVTRSTFIDQRCSLKYIFREPLDPGVYAIEMDDRCWEKMNSGISNFLDPADVLYFENALAFADDCNEFFLDRAANRLYYVYCEAQFRTGATGQLGAAPPIGALSFSFGNTKTLLNFQAGTGADNGVRHITLENLTFAYTGWKEIDQLAVGYSDYFVGQPYNDWVPINSPGFPRALNGAPSGIAEQHYYGFGTRVRTPASGGTPLPSNAPCYNTVQVDDAFENRVGTTCTMAEQTHGVQPPAVKVGAQSNDVQFINNRFQNLAGMALWLDVGAKNSLVLNNVFDNIAGNGIFLGGLNDAFETNPLKFTERNTIEGNYFADVSQEFYGSVGLSALYHRHSRIRYNTFDGMNGPCAMISSGFTDKPTYRENTLFERNWVVDCNQIGSDLGGIYYNGNQRPGYSTRLDPTPAQRPPSNLNAPAGSGSATGGLQLLSNYFAFSSGDNGNIYADNPTNNVRVVGNVFVGNRAPIYEKNRSFVTYGQNYSGLEPNTSNSALPIISGYFAPGPERARSNPDLLPVNVRFEGGFTAVSTPIDHLLYRFPLTQPASAAARTIVGEAGDGGSTRSAPLARTNAQPFVESLRNVAAFTPAFATCGSNVDRVNDGLSGQFESAPVRDPNRLRDEPPLEDRYAQANRAWLCSGADGQNGWPEKGVWVDLGQVFDVDRIDFYPQVNNNAPDHFKNIQARCYANPPTPQNTSYTILGTIGDERPVYPVLRGANGNVLDDGVEPPIRNYEDRGSPGQLKTGTREPMLASITPTAPASCRYVGLWKIGASRSFGVGELRVLSNYSLNNRLNPGGVANIQAAYD